MTANIEIVKFDGYSILKLSGDFNGTNENDALLSTFKDLAKDNNVKIIVDLQKVVYLNSGSIGVLLSGNALLKKKDGKVVLYGATDYLRNIFNITKLNLAFDICESEEESIEAIKK